MIFMTRKGEAIEFNPLFQTEIDAAKAIAPGEGIGPALSDPLVL